MADIKKKTCTKCGGDLILDKERKLYKCPFCGVAYGFSLFSDNNKEKAEEALMLGEFNEADALFSFLLTMDPHDFHALLGRILCAGKWKRVEDIRDASDYFGVRPKTVRMRIKEAINNCLPSDRPYFEKLSSVTDCKAEMALVDMHINPLMKEKKKQENERSQVLRRMNDLEMMYQENGVVITDEPGKRYYDKMPANDPYTMVKDTVMSLSSHLYEVQNKITPLKKKKSELARKFDAAYEELLAIRKKE